MLLACSAQLIDPNGRGFGDIYDVKGLSNGLPYYLGRATAYLLYSITGGKWCLSKSLGSTTCSASFTDSAKTADLITAGLVVGSVTDTAAGVTCYGIG